MDAIQQFATQSLTRLGFLSFSRASSFSLFRNWRPLFTFQHGRLRHRFQSYLCRYFRDRDATLAAIAFELIGIDDVSWGYCLLNACL